jgi:hypothetical protein
VRNLFVSLCLSSALLGAAACGGDGVYSPSDPAKFDGSMVNEDGLAGLDADQRAYVMGHAIGVYTMGKTVPSRVYWKGYLYRPGQSSQFAEVAYEWEDVLVARSGGSDGNGGAIYDDVGIDQDDTNDPGSPGNGDGFGEDPPEETGEPSDDVEPGDDDGDDHGECGVIYEDCELFLDPATNDARDLADKVDPGRFAPELEGAALERFSDLFRAGMYDALTVQVETGEVEHVKGSVVAYGLCVD